jgi:hypothetical protein
MHPRELPKVAESTTAAVMTTPPAADARCRQIHPRDQLTYPGEQTRAATRVDKQQQKKEALLGYVAYCLGNITPICDHEYVYELFFIMSLCFSLLAASFALCEGSIYYNKQHIKQKNHSEKI